MISESLSRRGLDWLAPGVFPALSVGLAWDRRNAHDSDWYTDGIGMEVALANVLTLRGGWFQNRGTVEDMTWGLGVGLPFGRIGGIRYDYARFPNAKIFEIEGRRCHAVTAFLDPIELWSARHRSPRTE